MALRIQRPIAQLTAGRRHNLPTSLSSFIGRLRELTDFQAQLARARLLTLTGVGGCGKTRLALEVASAVLDGYPDGVWLVELASLADGALVPQTVAAVFDLRETLVADDIKGCSGDINRCCDKLRQGPGSIRLVVRDML